MADQVGGELPRNRIHAATNSVSPMDSAQEAEGSGVGGRGEWGKVSRPNKRTEDRGSRALAHGRADSRSTPPNQKGRAKSAYFAPSS